MKEYAIRVNGCIYGDRYARMWEAKRAMDELCKVDETFGLAPFRREVVCREVGRWKAVRKRGAK